MLWVVYTLLSMYTVGLQAMLVEGHLLFGADM